LELVAVKFITESCHMV